MLARFRLFITLTAPLSRKQVMFLLLATLGKSEHLSILASTYSRVWFRNLYFGSNGANNVYSFLPSNGASITSFTADVNLFLKVSSEVRPIYKVAELWSST